MALSLLQNNQVGELSACHLALSLDVNSPKNKLENFLKRTKKILNAENAILLFQHEPYAWSHDKNNIFASCQLPSDCSESLFKLLAHSTLTSQHPNVVQYNACISKNIKQYQRTIAFPLLSKNNQIIGQIVLLDDKASSFEAESCDLVESLIVDLIEYLELKTEFLALQESYEELSALNFSKTKFFQIIAHDLRAPFHGLIGFSEVLAKELDTLDTAGVESIATYLNDTAESTYHLLENLLNWAMAEGGRFIYQPINFSLQQASNIVVNVLTSFAMSKKIQLIDRIPADLKVFADLNMVTSVLQNLVSNALKFTPIDGTGKVILSAERQSDYICFYVQDSGLGMNNIQIKNIFEPKLKTSLKGTAGEKGTGLGLMLCKRFVELNNGSISVSSREGQGTLFSVQLPCAETNHSTFSLEKKMA